MILAGCIVLAVAASDARAFSIGGHAAYSQSGDVNENSTGFGIQAAARVNDILSIRVSGTGFSDSDQEMNLDITSIALSGLAGTKLTEQFEVYAGAGVNFNIFNGRIDMLELTSAAEGLTVEEYAQVHGGTVEQAQAYFAASDVSANVKLNQTFGYHVCAGAAWEFADGVQLFGEYRYNWAKLKGDLSMSASGLEVSIGTIDEDYDFGLIMLGINLIM